MVAKIITLQINNITLPDSTSPRSLDKHLFADWIALRLLISYENVSPVFTNVTLYVLLAC